MSIKIGGVDYVIGGYAKYEILKRHYRGGDASKKDKLRYPEVIYPTHVINNIMGIHPHSITGGGGSEVVVNPVLLTFNNIKTKLKKIELDTKKIQDDVDSIFIPDITADYIDNAIQQYISEKDILKRIQLLYDVCNIVMPKIDIPNIQPTTRDKVREMEKILEPVLAKCEELIADAVNKLNSMY